MSESVVEWKPRPRNRVYIRLSGGRFFTVPESEIPALEPGSVLADEDVERLSRIDQYARGKEKAVRLLAIRPRTRHEIRNALDGMDLEPAVRDGVVDELLRLGLIDDARFARDYVRSRVEVKGLGPHRLNFELKKLGVPPSIVETAIAELITSDTQEETARAIIAKKLGARRAGEKDIRRLSALLRRKGIDYEVINRVLYDVLRHAGEEQTFEDYPE